MNNVLNDVADTVWQEMDLITSVNGADKNAFGQKAMQWSALSLLTSSLIWFVPATPHPDTDAVVCNKPGQPRDRPKFIYFHLLHTFHSCGLFVAS